MPAGVPDQLSLVQQINGTNPAAGSEITETVPADRWWKLTAVSVVLVQGLTQTPQPILVIDDGADIVFQSLGASAAQAASTTARYTWAPGLALATAGTTPNIHSQAPLPADLVLEPGWRIRTSTIGIGANTDYAAPSLLVVEYGA